MAAFDCFFFRLFLVLFFWGSRAVSILSTFSLSLSFVRRWVIQCLIFFLSFSVFFCPFLCPCPYGMRFCLPAIGQTQPFGVFASGDSAIHLSLSIPSHPIPPIHAFGYPSIHPCIHSHCPFFHSIHPSQCVPTVLLRPSVRPIRTPHAKCPIHLSLSYPTCVHPSCRLCKPSTLLVCTFVPWKRRPSIQSREARQ